MKLSVLDVVPVASGSSPAESLRRMVDLARLADGLGYARYWFAEHHGMAAIASSTPELLIAHAASATERIRVGSGGVMLPNHTPLKVAEAYRTLSALYPGRVDLGIGRAAGTDPLTARALRASPPEQFAQQMAELLAFDGEGFPAGHPFNRITVVPADAQLPPIWLLGSSGASARYAGQLGVGYGFAQHFSPTPAGPAFDAYRAAFEPSPAFPRPHAILALSVICAPTRAEAEEHARSMELVWHLLRKGETAALPSPAEARAYPWTAAERAAVAPLVALQIVGAPDEVAATIADKAAAVGADEVMVTTMVHDHAARLRSYQLVAEACGVAA